MCEYSRHCHPVTWQKRQVVVRTMPQNAVEDTLKGSPSFSALLGTGLNLKQPTRKKDPPPAQESDAK